MSVPAARPDAGASGRAGRNRALDGLRGYAAATVVVYHAVLGCSPTIIPAVLVPSVLAQRSAYGWTLKIVLSALSGEVAVALFFVMSGMVLFRAVSSLDRDRGPILALSWRFLLRRLLRLWPPMAVCLVATTVATQVLQVVAPGVVGSLSWSDLGRNLVLAGTPVIGVTWTLAVELAAAPWILVTWLGLRRLGLWRGLALLALELVLLRAVGGLKSPPGMIPGLPMLLTGALLAAGLPLGRRRPQLLRAALPAGATIVFADEMFVAVDRAQLHAFVLLIGATLIVGAVAAAEDGLVHRVLHAPVSQYLGRVSYSLYLWNSIVLYIVLGLVGAARTELRPLEIGLVAGLAGVLLTIPLAHLSELWTERPCIHLGRALTRGPRERAAHPPRPALAEPITNAESG